MATATKKKRKTPTEIQGKPNRAELAREALRQNPDLTAAGLVEKVGHGLTPLYAAQIISGYAGIARRAHTSRANGFAGAPVPGHQNGNGHGHRLGSLLDHADPVDSILSDMLAARTFLAACGQDQLRAQDALDRLTAILK